jgi:hypothetical protein
VYQPLGLKLAYGGEPSPYLLLVWSKLFAESMLFETIAVALDVDHPGVMEEPVEDG